MANPPRDDQLVTPGSPFVLIVEDHADTREAYSLHLRLSGFRTCEAENGAVGIRMARELHPDVIVLDYAMPLMDGVQASLFLKRDASTRTIPILMLTAFREALGGRAQCDAYLDKPCSPHAMVDKLRELLASKQSA